MSYRHALLLAAAALFPGGCGQAEQLKVYPVEGVLLANGEPAANANVAFYPLDSAANPRCSVARTDDRGRFHLTTRTYADGAPEGEYAVTVLWPDPTIEVDECECPDLTTHDLLKGLYANADRSDLRATVRPSGNSICLNVWRPRGFDPPR